MKRITALACALAVCTLAACKDVPSSATSPTNGGTTSSFVRPGQNVIIKSVRQYAPNDDVGGANNVYYIVTFNWTNDLGYALVPQMNHFVYQDTNNTRYLGEETGNPALVGISNYDGQLKVGDSHDYTVGFRVPQGDFGTLFYDPTF